jgi:hypothetical protein
VAPYKVEYKNILRSEYPEQREDWIDGEHMKTFGGWLQTRLMNVTDEEQLYLLAKQPSSTISTFHGYEINGNTFYTFAQDKKSTNQNSGVRFDAAEDNGKKVTYYGYIEEIWELDYLIFTNWRHHTSLHVNSHGLMKIIRLISLEVISGR